MHFCNPLRTAFGEKHNYFYFAEEKVENTLKKTFTCMESKLSRKIQNDKLRIRSSEELSNQMEGLLILKKVLSLTLKNGFSGGTLLGAYRDGDFIPWDWDIEVTVLTEEAINKKDLIINNLLESGFILKKQIILKKTLRLWLKVGGLNMRY